MKSQHTPGPWVIGVTKKHRVDIDAPNGDERFGHPQWEGLIRCYGCTDCDASYIVARSNARLVAAAPEMYDLLVRVANDCWGRDLGEDALRILDRIHGKT